MNKPNLDFPRNDAGERDGLGDAGIETFRNAPFASCAREAGQNSRDAADGSGRPVKMTFQILEVARTDIPGVDSLQKTIELCLENAHDDKEKEFFGNAYRVICKPSIPVLHIADFNTIGLVGPADKPGTPFNSLLKARGISSKESETSGGSFGIGKNASLAVSELQTVFYSTRYQDPVSKQERFAAQGKVILVSHTGADGNPRRATGYWGIPEGFNAVTEEMLVPEWMRRDEIGTSIFSIGFCGNDTNWKELMTCSLIANFFTAIQQEKIEFTVDDIHINANTIRALLNSERLMDAVRGNALRAELQFAKELYRCLTSELAAEEFITIRNLGRVRLRILADKGAPRRVGFIRNGMLITDSLRFFGHKFARFSRARDFVCLVEPADNEAGKLMKRLEDPQHKDFSAERIPDPDKRQLAFKAMKKLGDEIKALIKSEAGMEVGATVVVNELAHLFGEGATQTGTPGPENDPEKYTYGKPKRVSKRSDFKPASGSGGDSVPGHEGKKNNKETSTEKNNNRNRPTGGSRRKAFPLKDVRNRVVEDGSLAGWREIYFSAPATGRIELGIQALGLNDAEPLTVAEARTGDQVITAKDGVVTLNVNQTQRHSVSIRIREAYKGPIEVFALQVGTEEAVQ